MAEAVEPHATSHSNVVKSLYELSLICIAKQFTTFKKLVEYWPDKVFFDLHHQLFKEKKLCLLSNELSQIQVFAKMLKVRNRRIDLLQAFQALMDHGTKIASELATSYGMCTFELQKVPHAEQKVIYLGLTLGGFLSDGGWYCESRAVLASCLRVCQDSTDAETPENLGRTLFCCQKLLHAAAAYCEFDQARTTYKLALDTIKKLEAAGHKDYCYAPLYTEFSVLFFIRSEYDEAYKWSLAALKALTPNLPPRTTVDVLRQAAKSCVVTREFQKAGLLIRQAVYLAREVFDTDHPTYANVLIDYGFYLLNYDSIINSVSVYQTALEIRKSIFGKMNLHVAIAHEDLAYALYVQDYASGRFTPANENATKAIEIMEKLLPSEHLMLASAKRVKALILEEIALDNAPTTEEDLLARSEDLHLSALSLAKTAFGERNVQTAKHYGNLGRLYQSMRRFSEAESMHLKAIGIKEELLGPEDYEVGLSIGHLASLYNFHMGRYRDAEALYLRSIRINLKLFGQSYSGLEYDYRGLLHVYTELQDYEKVSEYQDLLGKWRNLRDEHVNSEDPPIDLNKRPEPIEKVIEEFFST